MRIAGWVLLLAGFVLCLTVAWAALGFLLMGIGLVSLQVAERKRRKAEKAAAVAALDARPEPAAALVEAPPAHAENVPITAEPPPLPAPQTTSSADASAYDKEVWRRLVESDPDLARLAAVLSDYGQHHVDEFANSYLAQPDKGRLGAIVSEIIAKAARKESAPAAQPEVHEPSVDANQEPKSPPARIEPGRSLPKIHAPKVAVVPPAANDVRSTRAAAIAPRILSAPEIRIPNPEHGNDRITSADDDLSELIRTFANDASSPPKMSR
ncbi:hypothetical protein [Bradyrhizobium sp. Leo170]|uniref:hypothetical protein n=1 Tax=Bradyrhizobium sp. Leo170 TaxID=1571199 RepID=UPI00102E4091|nr:hypothetical protein [Bradyrhizobium sp. Leo170]